jgi:hypothetical protein
MVLHWLHQVSDLTILIAVVSAITGLAMLAPHVGRHVLRFPISGGRDDAAFDAYKAVMSMVGVVLAFSLVQANNNLRQFEVTVAKEGAAIAATDRALLRIGKPELSQLRPLLASYAREVINEWPLLAQGERSSAADDAYTALSKRARAIGPDDTRQQAMYNELLKGLDDLSDLREEILADSEYGLPTFFWITICCFLALGLVLAALTTSTLGRTVGAGALAAGVALLLAFVIIVDLPFEGETKVSPKPIEKAIVANAHRT